jgi:hypothetical protein
MSLDDNSSAVFTSASVLAVAAGTTTTLVVWAEPNNFDEGSGDLFKDLGKTVVAKDANGNAVTFRLVQFVDPGTPETNGVPPDAGYGVGYIMLGLNGASSSSFTNAEVAKVAKYGL